jgi:predicted oxidoreductase (fatty acid repression mutant protein)
MGSTTTPPATANADTFLELIKARRSFYPLNKDLPISTSRVQTIVAEALQHIPSSFNSQSNRAVVLFGAEHDKLWDITSDVLKAIVAADQFEATAKKISMFKGAAGTVLFFEDQTVVEGMQARFPLYADR